MSKDEVKKLAREIAQDLFPRCDKCGHYFEYEVHGIIKRRCGGFDPEKGKGIPRVAIVPKEGKEKAPVWCPKRQGGNMLELVEPQKETKSYIIQMPSDQVIKEIWTDIVGMILSRSCAPGGKKQVIDELSKKLFICRKN